MNEVNVFKRVTNVYGDKMRKFSLPFELPNFKDIFRIILTIMLSRTGILTGLYPFSMSYFATYSTQKMYLGLAGVVVGLISANVGFVGILKYSMASIIYGVYTYMFKAVKKNNLLTATVCGLCLFISGAVCSVPRGLVMYDVLTLFIESTIAGAGVVILQKGSHIIGGFKNRTKITQSELISLSLTVGVVLMSLTKLPYGGMAANIICLCTIMLLGVNVGVANTCVIGILSGAICGFNSLETLKYVGIYSLFAICSSVLRPIGRFGIAAGVLGCYSVIMLYSGSQIELPISVFEVLIATVTFLLVPKKVNVFIKDFFAKTITYTPQINTKNFVTMRLNAISEAFDTLSATFKELSNKKPKEMLDDPSSMFDATAERVCVDCSLAKHCWQKEFDSSYDAMLKMFEKIETKGYADVLDAPDFFSQRCIRLDQLVTTLNHMYELYRVNVMHREDICQAQEILYTQYGDISSIVNELSKSLENGFCFMPDYEHNLIGVLDENGIQSDMVCVLQTYSDNLEAYISVLDKAVETLDAEKLANITSEVLGERMLTDITFSENVLRLYSQARYDLDIGVTMVKKAGQELCGDNYALIKTNDNKYALLLSDGMGSGKKASKASNAATTLLTRFLAAGFDRQTAIGFINSTLVSQGYEEAFATVDLSVVDLNSLWCDFIKLGATTTFIIQEGVIESIDAHTMPIGILSSIDLEQTGRRLSVGDIVIMMTDGVYEGNINAEDKEKWIKEQISLMLDIEDMQAFSDRLIETVLSATRLKPADDMTVLVARVKEG